MPRQPDARADVAAPVLLDHGFSERKVEVDRGNCVAGLVVRGLDEPAMGGYGDLLDSQTRTIMRLQNATA
jgi:hypothetical protein